MTDAITPTTDAPECRHHGVMTLRTETDPKAAPTWYCPNPICHNTVLQPAADVAPKGTLEINHTRADGTLLEGSRKNDGVFEIVRHHRFWYGRSLPGVLFIRQSRDKAADRWSIRRAAEALREAGWTVVVDIDEDTRRSFAEAEADRVERAEDRAERFSGYAENAAAESDRRRNEAHRIASSIPFGQPILVGHHSQRRAERDRDRIDTNMRKGIEAGERAGNWEGRARAAGNYERFRKNPGTTLRRIGKLEAELRAVEKWLRGESAHGYTRALNPAGVAELNREKAELEEQLAYWRQVVADAEANGFKVWSKADFKKGDFAKIRGRWYEVLRVNAKTLTVPGGPDIQPVISLETHEYPGMRNTSPYDEVTSRMSAEEMQAKLAAAREKAAEQASS